MTTTTTPPIVTVTPAPDQSSANVNVPAMLRKDASVWTTSRVIALVFTVLEVLLLVRFTLKLLGANAEQNMVGAIYGITEPLVAPFRGIFAQPTGTPVVDISAVLSIIFLLLVAALILAVVRAFTGKRGELETP